MSAELKNEKIEILEYINIHALRPTGGPVGYVYELYKADNLNGNKLSYLDIPTNNGVLKNNTAGFIKDIIRKIWYLKIILIGRRCDVIESNEYDIIHFHTTLDLYNNRRSVQRFNGKTVLTSHSPTLASKEIYQSWNRLGRILFKPLSILMRKMDYGAFQLADYIVFPCPEAEEPYSHAWKGFEQFKKKNKTKFKYLLTGTSKRKVQKDRNEIRKELCIPENAFVISYVGRHNEIKGYDALKKIGEIILDKHPNIYFLIAGKEEPLKGLDNKRWIEIGWTDDPHSYICAADIFVLPNKETFFDLVLIEVLSLGKIVLLSKNGGNRFFDSPEYPGIFLYTDISDAIKRIESIMKLSEAEFEILQEKNILAYDNKFNDIIFYNNYLKLMNEIYNE